MSKVRRSIGYSVVPLVVLLLASIGEVRAQLIVTKGSQLPAGWTADSLVRNILLGEGVVVSNVRFNNSSGVINCDAIGKFTTGSTPTNLGMTDGIIIGSGGVQMAVANYTDAGYVASNCNSPSCPPLQNIVSASLNDIAILEFDFVPITDSIQFEYVFGSEEYPVYVCSEFNDVFGFFITGQNPVEGQPDYNNKNIALLPNSNIPITINTVNGGSADGDYGWYMYEEYNCDSTNSEYFVNNNEQFIEYNGFTVVLTASASVVPNTSYHLMMAIGDAFDDILDSGVFLKARSLSSVSEDLFVTLCYGECYDFFDSTICTSGVYTHQEGLQITVLNLTILPKPENAVSESIVENQLPWTYADSTFTAPADSVLFVFTDDNGCDSLVYYSLEVSYNTDALYDTVICDNRFPLVWHGYTFQDTGTFHYTLTAANGADSVVTFVIGQYPTYVVNESAKICDGETYRRNGYEFSSSGTYPIHLYSVNSCDSTIVFTLTVFELSHTYIYDTCMISELPWTWGGRIYPAPIDDDIFYLSNSYGCDSLVHYNLTAIWDCDEFLQFPSVVTPNGDGLNDLFIIEGLLEESCYPLNRLTVYNRWGAKVYEVENIDDIEEFWNPASDRIPAGTYFFRFDGDGFKGHVERKGTVEVIK